MCPEKPIPLHLESEPPRKEHESAPSARNGRFHFSTMQMALAIGIAAISDVICAASTPAPPVVWVVDVLTAVLLFGVLGWHWLLLPGLIMEAIPGLSLLPLWLIVVLAIIFLGSPRPKLKWFPGRRHD